MHKAQRPGQPEGGEASWAPSSYRGAPHLPLLRLLGNRGGAPFERKRRANQEVRGEPLQQRGRLAHFPFLRALGTFSRRDRGTAGASRSEGSLYAAAASAGTTHSSCQSRQPARSGVPRALAAGEHPGKGAEGSGGRQGPRADPGKCLSTGGRRQRVHV